MSREARPLGESMYIDTEEAVLWLQSVQRKLYARSRENPDYQFQELWGLVTDPCNLRIAFVRVQRNRGARSAGVDRITARKIVQQGMEQFLAVLRKELRDGSFRPSPVRRVLIPKAGGQRYLAGFVDRVGSFLGLVLPLLVALLLTMTITALAAMRHVRTALALQPIEALS
jgi:hypothetical protein